MTSRPECKYIDLKLVFTVLFVSEIYLDVSKILKIDTNVNTVLKNVNGAYVLR